LPSLCVALMCCASAPLAAFQLETLGEQRVDVADYTGKGRWTLVFLWSVDCIPCEKQKPMIESFHVDHSETNASVLGIVTDGIEEIDDINILMERHQPSYPNLVVFSDVFSRQFTELTGQPFRVTPTYILYDPTGKYVGTHTGPISRASLEDIVGAAN